MKTVQELLVLASNYLQEERGRWIAEELLAFVLKKKRLDLYLLFDCPLEEKEIASFRDLLQRVKKKEPIEYVMGRVPFGGLDLFVTPAVLIPRPETELLIDLIAKRFQGKILWDVCTGSGALGLSLKKKIPSLEVTVSDVSKEALQVAQENGRRGGVEVRYLEGDLLAPFRGEKADAIVCNPPYLSEKEYQEAPVSVRGFEPKGALVGGEDGLLFYRRLSEEAPLYLQRKGKLFLEIGFSQKKALQQIFSSPQWAHTEVLQDYSGKDRFFFLEKQ